MIHRGVSACYMKADGDFTFYDTGEVILYFYKRC